MLLFFINIFLYFRKKLYLCTVVTPAEAVGDWHTGGRQDITKDVELDVFICGL